MHPSIGEVTWSMEGWNTSHIWRWWSTGLVPARGIGPQLNCIWTIGCRIRSVYFFYLIWRKFFSVYLGWRLTILHISTASTITRNWLCKVTIFQFTVGNILWSEFSNAWPGYNTFRFEASWIALFTLQPDLCFGAFLWVFEWWCSCKGIVWVTTVVVSGHCIYSEKCNITRVLTSLESEPERFLFFI